MTIKAGTVTPALVDAMNGVAAIDGLGIWVYLQVPFFLIAVVIQDDVDRTIVLRCDTEDGGMTRTGHLDL